MIVTQGGRFGGYGLFLSKGEFGFDRGRVVFLYNLLDLKRTMWEGPELDSGQAHHRVRLQAGWSRAWARAARACCTWTVRKWPGIPWNTATPITFPEDETFDIGQDTRTPVALLEYRYDVPFKFTGKIDKLTFDLDPEQARK